MRVIQSLFSAAALIASINAAPAPAPCLDHQYSTAATGWAGQGVYLIKNLATGTSVDLFHGINPVNGWKTNPTPNQEWKFSQAGGDANKNKWVIQNIPTGGAITDIEFNQVVLVKPVFNDISQLWTITETSTGGPVFLVSAKDSRNVLDLAFAKPDNGTPIVVFTKSSSNAKNQQWVLQKIRDVTIDADSTPQTTPNDHMSLTINVVEQL